jgi:hypothetical protein
VNEVARTGKVPGDEARMPPGAFLWQWLLLQTALNNETLASICPLQMSPKHHGPAMIAADADLALRSMGPYCALPGDLTGDWSAS